MNGTVTRLRPRGVEALMDSDTSNLTEQDQFEVYRVVDGSEVIVGTYFAKRSKGPNQINLNRVDGADAEEDPVVGDLVRSV